MARPSLHSIRFKASALVTLIVVLVTCLGTTVSLRETSRAMYSKELARIDDWSAFISRGNVRELARGDRAALAKVAQDLIDSHRGVYAAFTSPDGQILASAEAFPGIIKRHIRPDGKLQLSPTDRPAISTIEHLSLTYADICVPLRLSPPASEAPGPSPVKGYLRFGVNVSDTRASLAVIARQYLEVGVVLLLLLVPVSVVLTSRVLAPIRELARAARAIATGSMDARAAVASADEIGELALSFNQMAEWITESQLELLKLNAELEERVKQRTQELAELASRDPLTGLYNRRHFGEVITREFAACERYGDDLTCLMFDVDHFKSINDQYGHRTGDAILMSLATAIAGELRGSDVAARFGGDEFILLLPQTAAVSASSLADRIAQSFEREVHRTYPGISPTLSIGAASLRTTRARSSEALIHESDLALYAAKQAGRGRMMEATAGAA